MTERVAWLCLRWLWRRTSHDFVALTKSDEQDEFGVSLANFREDDACDFDDTARSHSGIEAVLRAALAVAEADKALRGQQDAALDVRYGQ